MTVATMKLNIESYVEDDICDVGNLDWEYKGEFDDLMDNEMQKMTFVELERQELERMKFNAFKVREELTSTVDGARMLNGFMKSQTSLPISKLFFNNEEYLKRFITAALAKILLIPGYNYFLML